MSPRRRRHRGLSTQEPEQVLYAERSPKPGKTLRLEGSEADHARKSLRLHTGDAVHLVDGKGGRFPGRVVELDKRGVGVVVEGAQRIPAWPRRTIWLAAGILRSARMDIIIEKASELGVARLIPLALERCVARPHEEGAKQDRWHRLALESLKQAKRARLMEVTPPMILERLLEEIPSGATIWAADRRGSAPPGATTPSGTAPVTLVVGPEGGLTPREVELLKNSGTLWVGLGGHRLRAETAAVTLLVSALSALGELGGSERTIPR